MTVLTVRQVLELPSLKSSRLVAGEKGLDNVVRWVHVVDLKNARYEWQRQGVLLLTSGLGFDQNSTHQKALIARLVQLKFSGLVLSTGYYFKQVPREVCHEADRLGLPVIETPPDLLFIQITETVLEHIVNQKYTMLRQSAQVNQQLTDLVLRGASWQDFVWMLSESLHRSVVIELPTLQVVAIAQHNDVEAAWIQTAQQGRSLPEIADYLTEANVYTVLQKTHQPHQIRPSPELGLSSACLVAPIVINQNIHGYVWLLAGTSSFSSLDEQALSHGATVVGLMVSKEQAVRYVKMAQQGDFLTQILDPQGASSQLQEQAQRFNFRLSMAHQVVLIQFADTSTESLSILQTVVQQQLIGHFPTSLIARRETALVVILEAEQLSQGKQFAHRIAAALDPQEYPVVIGLGTICPSSSLYSGGLRQSYEQAQEAAHIAVLLKQTGAIAFSELGLLHWLYHLAPEHRVDNLYLHHVRTLANHDIRRSASLLGTLEAYLDHGQSVAETAEILFIHRNTLLNRLERIEALCKLNLRDANQALNLNIAIKSYRLHG